MGFLARVVGFSVSTSDLIKLTIVTFILALVFGVISVYFGLGAFKSDASGFELMLRGMLSALCVALGIYSISFAAGAIISKTTTVISVRLMKWSIILISLIAGFAFIGLGVGLYMRTLAMSLPLA